MSTAEIQHVQISNREWGSSAALRDKETIWEKGQDAVDRLRKEILQKARTAIFLIVGYYTADTVRVCLPVEQPVPVASSHFSLVHHTRNGTDMKNILHTLRTYRDVEKFLDANTSYEKPEDPMTFLAEYRKSPEDLLESGTGACNAYAEFWAEWLALRGEKPYLVTMRPDLSDPDQGRLGIDRFIQWHIVTVIRRRDPVTRGLLYDIYDNTKRVTTSHSLADYAEKYQMTIPSFGGIRPWEKTQDDFRAKFWSQAGFSLSEEEMEESIPKPSTQSAPTLAMK